MPLPNCPLSNFSYYAGLVRSDCNGTLDMCEFNNEKFRCCDFFLPLKTEMGTCYSLNSIQAENPNGSKLDMYLNHYSGTGTVFRMEVLTEANVWFLCHQPVLIEFLGPISGLSSRRRRRAQRGKFRHLGRESTHLVQVSFCVSYGPQSV